MKLNYGSNTTDTFKIRVFFARGYNDKHPSETFECTSIEVDDNWLTIHRIVNKRFKQGAKITVYPRQYLTRIDIDTWGTEEGDGE